MKKRLRKRKNSLTIADKRRIRWILERIDNKQAFLQSLVKSLIIALEQGNFEQLKENINSWSASAEIDSVPGAKKRILETHRAYQANKNISRNWKKFEKELGIRES